MPICQLAQELVGDHLIIDEQVTQIHARGFDFLSPLEQRWALGLAVSPDHKVFLEEQARSGRWRLTARWRLAVCG